MKDTRLPKFFSLATAILAFLAGLTSSLSITSPSLIFGFLLIISFISMMVGLFYVQKTASIYGILGLIFATVYGVFISFNYYLQFVFIHRIKSTPEWFEMTNPDSIFMAIEILGYFFMGMATLCFVPLLNRNKIGNAIKILFIINGILGIGGFFGYALEWDFNILIYGLILWNLILPIAALLLFFYFKKMATDFTDNEIIHIN